MKKIGIVGGTFDPIHMGHLLLAEKAYSDCKLDSVYLVPSGFSYFKADKKVEDKETRFIMTGLAAANNPHFVVSDIECKREGNSYTVDTLEEFHSLHPNDELYLIMGADSIFEIETWRNPTRIFELAGVIAAARDDVDALLLGQKCEELTLKYGARIEVMDFPRVEISSTDIRNRIKEGLSVKYMLPDAIYEYIERNNLYKD